MKMKCNVIRAVLFEGEPFCVKMTCVVIIAVKFAKEIVKLTCHVTKQCCLKERLTV